MCKLSEKPHGDVAPTISSGLIQWKGGISLGWATLTAVYAAVYFGLRESRLLKPDPAYCQATKPGLVCSRSDLAAFQVASGIAISLCGVLGFYTWHMSRTVHTKLPQTPAGRLYGYLPESETLAAINFTFQLWDFFVSLMIPEHRGALMLMHHVAACTVCFLSLHYQVLHYYGVFFLGVTEFSSLFLVFIDLAKFFPPEAGTIYDAIAAVMGPLFAVAFTIYRVVLWWQVSFLLWQDCYHVVTTGISNQLRPGKNFVLYMFLVLNVPLGFLQLYWFSIILGEAQKLLAGEESTY